MPTGRSFSAILVYISALFTLEIQNEKFPLGYHRNGCNVSTTAHALLNNIVILISSKISKLPLSHILVKVDTWL